MLLSYNETELSEPLQDESRAIIQKFQSFPQPQRVTGISATSEAQKFIF